MFALSYRHVNSSSGIGRLNWVNCKCFRLSFAMKTDKPLVSVFMLTQALAMGVTNGRQTPRPPETPTNDAHQPIVSILRATAFAITFGLDALTACHMG